MQNLGSNSNNNEQAFVSNQGSIQHLRFPIPLQSGYVELEERGLEQWLRQAYDYAKNTKFINEDNQVDGNWSELLARNDTVLLALIAQYPIEKYEQRLNRALTGRFDSDIQLSFTLLKLIVSLIKELNAWHIRLQIMQTDAARVVSRRLFEFIQASKTPLSQAYRIHKSLYQTIKHHRSARFMSESQAIEALFDTLGASWVLPSEIDIEGGVNAKREYRYELERAFYHFSNGIKQLAQCSKQQIQASMSAKKQDPASALLVAFLALLVKVNKKTNGLTDRYRDFYYRDVLKIAPRSGQPDHAVLLIKPNKQQGDNLVQRGTCFLAETRDLEHELKYVVDSDTYLVPANVSAIANCYLQRSPFSVPSFYLGLIDAIDVQYHSNYQFMESTWKKPSQQNSNPLGQHKSLFGASLKDGQVKEAQHAEIGFIISSQALFAKQGHRRFHIQCELEARSADFEVSDQVRHEQDAIDLFRSEVFSAFKEYLFQNTPIVIEILQKRSEQLIQILNQQSISSHSFNDHVKQSLQALAEIQNQDYDTFRNKVFSKGFKLVISIHGGWYRIDKYNCTFECRQNLYNLELSFELDHAQPAVIACNQQYHNTTLVDGALLSSDLNLPALKILLADDVEFYLYSLLQDLVLINNRVNVEVEGIKELLVHNDMGAIDTSAPFQPFGPQPKNGDSLIIGGQEFSHKNIHSLSVNIQWHQIPNNIGGFSDYYRDYDLNISNDDFKVSDSVLINGDWYAQNPDETQVLFSADEEGKLSSHSSLQIRDAEFFQSLEAQKEYELGYSAKSHSGFVKLELTGKPHAFFHALYPHILNSKLVASIKTKKPDAKPLAEPYTPLISKISVDYKASSNIEVEHLSKPNASETHRLFCVNPFGVQSFQQRAREDSAYILPQYLDASCVYIGLDIHAGSHNDILTLYFDLLESSIQRMREGLPMIEWAWLSKENTWQMIENKNIIKDTTSGFLKSGIVTLRLPLQALQPHNRHNDEEAQPCLFDVDKRWIRVSTRELPHGFCQLQGVEINAIQVRREPVQGEQICAIAPGSIKKSESSLSGIQAIYQPRASFSGKAKESQATWVQRSAERLRHRNRLVTPWDYERVVLEEFEFIDQVKCFPSYGLGIENGKPQRSPGQLLLVVIPTYPNRDARTLSEPPEMISGAKLNAIKAYLEPLAGDGISIHVCNPSYEYLQVRCSVLFSNNMEDEHHYHTLNTDLIDYLSSWGSIGPNKQFEWSYCENDLTAFICGLPYVDFVTGLSLLKVTKLEAERYLRTDSVSEPRTHSNSTIEAQYPWCIPIPVNHHAISTLGQRHLIQAKATGFSELEIGRNFILS